MKDPDARGRDDAFLPSDPGYWSGLRDRIVAAGAPTVDGYASGARPGLEVRPRTAAVLAACAVLATLASWAFLPPPRTNDTASVLARALLPDDPLAERLLADEPPSLAAYLGGGESP